VSARVGQNAFCFVSLCSCVEQDAVLCTLVEFANLGITGATLQFVHSQTTTRRKVVLQLSRTKNGMYGWSSLHTTAIPPRAPLVRVVLPSDTLRSSYRKGAKMLVQSLGVD